MIGLSKNVIEWEVNERPPHEYASEYNLTIGAATVGMIVLAVIFEAYSAVLLILFGGAMIIYLTKLPNPKFFFKLTRDGLITDNTAYHFEDIAAYNIFDDPNERAHLLLRVNRMEGAISIPMLDVDINSVDQFFASKKIQRDGRLVPTFVDRLLEFI